MKKMILAGVAVAAVLLAFAPAALAIPGNDDVESAYTVTPPGTTGSTAGATAQSGEPAHAGVAANHSVWYSYTATSNKPVWVNTCGAASFDSVLSVYTGGAGLVRDSSDFPSCNTGEGAVGAFVQFTPTAGATYAIAVDSANGSTGSFPLNVFADVPTAFIDSGPTGNTTDRTPTFGFHSDLDGAEFFCDVEPAGGAPDVQDCGASGTYTAPALGYGTYKFYVVAIDPETGGYNVYSANRTFKVVKPVTPPDKTPPQTTITAHPKSKTTKKKAGFAFSSSEAGSSFECSLNGKPFAPCASPKTVTAAKGNNLFQVRATDKAGNTDASPATFSWKYKKKKKHHHGGKHRGSGQQLAAPSHFVLP